AFKDEIGLAAQELVAAVADLARVDDDPSWRPPRGPTQIDRDRLREAAVRRQPAQAVRRHVDEAGRVALPTGRIREILGNDSGRVRRLPGSIDRHQPQFALADEGYFQAVRRPDG